MGGLTAAGLATIGGRLEAFADDLFASLPRADQLGEVNHQALYHLVAVSPWDWRPVCRRLAEVLTAALSPTAWVVDDTGFPKDGSCSVGVQRQYSGTLGKTANRQLGCRSAPSPSRPAARWTGGCLCPSAGTRMRWRSSWDLSPPVLLADCGYGEVGAFRGGWTPASSPTWWRSGLTPAPTPSRCTRVSRRTRAGVGVPGPHYHDKPCSLTRLALAAGQQACVDLIWRRGSKGLQRGRFLALRVRPAGVTPRRLRWRVEQDYRELKGALGLDHFEGRSFPGWHHHVTLVSVAHGFLTLERLRSPNLVASA